MRTHSVTSPRPPRGGQTQRQSAERQREAHESVCVSVHLPAFSADYIPRAVRVERGVHRDPEENRTS